MSSTIIIKSLPPYVSLGRAIINFAKLFQSFIADTVLSPTQWVGGKKYNVSLRKLLQQGISEPEFYGDLAYRIRKIVGKYNFAEQFRKHINLYKRIGFNPFIMRQTACLVVNPITVDSYGLLFNCTSVVRASDSMMAPS